MSMDGNVMQMRRLDKGVELPAGKSVEFKPGALHIMLTRLHAPLKEGATISRCNSDSSERSVIRVKVKVESLTAQ